MKIGNVNMGTKVIPFTTLATQSDTRDMGVHKQSTAPVFTQNVSKTNLVIKLAHQTKYL